MNANVILEEDTAVVLFHSKGDKGIYNFAQGISLKALGKVSTSLISPFRPLVSWCYDNLNANNEDLTSFTQPYQTRNQENS